MSTFCEQSAPAPRAMKQAFGGVRTVMAGMALGVASMTATAFEAPGDGVYEKRIDWGVILDLSGPCSPQNIAYNLGFKTFMRKVNEAGGIHGRTINTLTEDDRCDGTQTRTAHEKLVNQTPVLGISGFSTSSGQAALMPTVRRANVPIVGAGSTTTAALQPPTPLFTGAWCGFNSMAQTMVGYFSETLKVKSPKVAIVYLDVSSGKDFKGFVEAEVAKRGGTTTAVAMKFGAADATAQVLEIVKMKPDFVVMHGVTPTALIVKRAMHQYGLKMPVVAITHQGAPSVFSALGPEAGSDFYFVSCFTPGSADPAAPGVKEMVDAAAKYGRAEDADDISYSAGWFAARLVSESLRRVGPQPTRDKLVAAMNTSFSLDTQGVAPVVNYTTDNREGTWLLRPYSYDYQAKKFKAHGAYSDSAKYIK